jgi:hypothetical protein
LHTFNGYTTYLRAYRSLYVLPNPDGLSHLRAAFPSVVYNETFAVEHDRNGNQTVSHSFCSDSASSLPGGSPHGAAGQQCDYRRLRGRPLAHPSWRPLFAVHSTRNCGAAVLMPRQREHQARTCAQSPITLQMALDRLGFRNNDQLVRAPRQWCIRVRLSCVPFPILRYS